MAQTIDTDGPAATERLPSPEDRSSADVVIYDGHCKLCAAQVKRLASWDQGQRLAFLSLHDPTVQSRYPDLSHDDLMNNVYLIAGSGRRYRGAAAFRYLSVRLPRLWWLAPLMHIPFSLPLWQFAYRQVAKRRYRFGRLPQCDNGACGVHFDNR